MCLADSHLPNCLESHVDVCSISQECDILKVADASSKKENKKKKTINKRKKWNRPVSVTKRQTTEGRRGEKTILVRLHLLGIQTRILPAKHY